MVKFLREYSREYFAQMRQRKIQIAAASVISLVLFAISFYYLSGGGVKRIILFTAMSVLTGVLIAFPMPFPRYLSVPACIGYLLVIPSMMFRRIEFPVHDMTHIMPGAQLANVLIIFLFFAVLLLLLQRPNLAFGIGAILILICLCANYYVTLFRGSGISYSDFQAIGTAMSVAGNYRLSMEAELWYSILYFAFFIVLGFWCKVPYKGKIYHGIVTAIAVGYMIFSGFFWSSDSYLEKHELKSGYWNRNILDDQKRNGFLLTFVISVKDSTMSKPVGYSESRLNRISEEAVACFAPANASDSTSENGTADSSGNASTDQIENSSTDTVSNAKSTPNIIFIMNEAWSDMRVLGNLETSEPFMPFVESLSENTTKGYTYVDILGGLTANSEFEALTGDSLAFLPGGVVPYQLYVDHDMHSLARVLKEQGYQTYAMHPSNAGAWNRENAFRYFGFDEFVELKEFETEYEKAGDFVSDSSNYDEIIYRYENRNPEQPFFLFDVTIQNHADYYYQVDTPIMVQKIGDTAVDEESRIADIWTYVNLMKMSDDAFAELVAYFEKVEEPTIICMFGDHQPKLSDEFYERIFTDEAMTEQEKDMLMHMTPYVIWSNYDSDFAEYGDFGANYLGSVLLECAGVELPAYNKFLLETKKQYPVLTHAGCIGPKGNKCNISDILDDEVIKNYRMLQYNHLVEEDYNKSIFSTINFP